jgi:hypothetical protein
MKCGHVSAAPRIPSPKNVTPHYIAPWIEPLATCLSPCGWKTAAGSLYST